MEVNAVNAVNAAMTPWLSINLWAWPQQYKLMQSRIGENQTLNHVVMEMQRALTNNVKRLSLYYDYY